MKRRRKKPIATRERRAELARQQRRKELAAALRAELDRGLFGPVRSEQKSPDPGLGRYDERAKKRLSYVRATTEHIPSFDLNRLPRNEPRRPTELSEEMQRREEEAQKEIARKRKRLAPLYNKGPVQYITDDTDLSDLGRKK